MHVGYIGKSTNPELTHSIYDKLIEETFQTKNYTGVWSSNARLAYCDDDFFDFSGLIDPNPESLAVQISGTNWSNKLSMRIAVKGSVFLFRGDRIEETFHVIDMRHSLGQIWFCESPEIWRKAIAELPELKEICEEDQKLIVYPPGQVWKIQQQGEEWSIRKFRLNRKMLLKVSDCIVENQSPCT